MRGMDAFTLDTKIDDGRPQSGKMLTYTYAYNNDCVLPSDDQYDVKNENAGCAFLFITGF